MTENGCAQFSALRMVDKRGPLTQTWWDSCPVCWVSPQPLQTSQPSGSFTQIRLCSGHPVSLMHFKDVALSYRWLKCLSLTSVPFRTSASMTWTALILRCALPWGKNTFTQQWKNTTCYFSGLGWNRGTIRDLLFSSPCLLPRPSALEQSPHLEVYLWVAPAWNSPVSSSAAASCHPKCISGTSAQAQNVN